MLLGDAQPRHWPFTREVAVQVWRRWCHSFRVSVGSCVGRLLGVHVAPAWLSALLLTVCQWQQCFLFLHSYCPDQFVMAWRHFCASSQTLASGQPGWQGPPGPAVAHVAGCCLVAAWRPALLIAGASWIDPCLHLLLTLVFAQLETPRNVTGSCLPADQLLAVASHCCPLRFVWT